MFNNELIERQCKVFFPKLCYLTNLEMKVSVPPESVEEGNDLLPTQLEGRFGAAGLRKRFDLLL